MSDPRGYEFVWSVRAPVDEVSTVMADPVEFARWWPSAWREVVEVSAGASNGVGRIVSARTRGRSPLALDWSARCAASGDDGWSWDLYGDLEGSVHVSARAEGERTRVTFAWKVALQKPSLRGVPLAEAVFARDLAWMMARGEESLALELARRASHELQGAPPGPTTPSSLPWTLAVAGAVTAAAGVVGLLLRRRP